MVSFIISSFRRVSRRLTRHPHPGKKSQRKASQKKPAETPAKTIWYLLVDHEGQLSFGDCTQIAVQADTNVDDLKKRIKDNRPNDLHPFDASRLEVWGVDIQTQGFSLESQVRKIARASRRYHVSRGQHEPRPSFTKAEVTPSMYAAF